MLNWKTTWALLVGCFLLDTNVSPVAAISCPTSWVASEQSGTCVQPFVLDVLMNWAELRDECRKQGGDVVKIINQEMNDFLLDLPSQYTSLQSMSRPWAWIGMNDLETEGRWVWLDETQIATWVNWMTGQPDPDYYDEDCSVLDFDMNGQWFDYDCKTFTKDMAYICEIPPLKTVNCPDGWVASQESGTCVQPFVGDSTLDWNGARADCQTQGGDLVKILNIRMNDFIYDLQSEYSILQGYVWTGLNDLSDEGTWVWLDETTEIAWDNWMTDEPGTGGTALDCAGLDYDSGGQWRDDSCSRLSDMVYLCEIPPIPSVNCASGWSVSDQSGTCILLNYTDETRTWHDARATCQSMGGDLVKIVNMEMNNFLFGLTSQYAFLTALDNSLVWIGLNDIHDEGTWVWLDETNEITWDNWLAGQPDPDYMYENCGGLDFDFSGQWRDLDCDTYFTGLAYFCETPPLFPDSTTTVTRPTTAATTTTTTRTTASESDVQITDKVVVALVTSSEPTKMSAQTESPALDESDDDGDNGSDAATSSTTGLSGGAVAGIVITCLLVAFVVLGYVAVRVYRDHFQRPSDRTVLAKEINHDDINMDI